MGIFSDLVEDKKSGGMFSDLVSSTSTDKQRSGGVELTETSPEMLKAADKAMGDSVPESETHSRTFELPESAKPRYEMGRIGESAPQPSTPKGLPSYTPPEERSKPSSGIPGISREEVQEAKTIGTPEKDSSIWDAAKLLVTQDKDLPEEYRYKPGEIYGRIRNIRDRVTAPVVGRIMDVMGVLDYEELNKELQQESSEFGGFGSALAPAAAETTKMAVEWGWLYPKLFKLAGLGGKGLSKIPQVQKGVKALKSMGGIQKIAKKYPRLASSVQDAAKSFTKGYSVGATSRGLETIGVDEPAIKVLSEANKRGAALGAISSAFSLASSADTARYANKLRNELIQRTKARYDSQIKPLIRQKGKAASDRIKSLAKKERLELQKIDDVVANVEAKLNALKSGKMYKSGQEKAEDPFKLAERLARRGIEFKKGVKYPKGESGYKKGLVKSEPFIKEPTTKTGKVAESVKRATERPIKAARLASQRRRIDKANKQQPSIKKIQTPKETPKPFASQPETQAKPTQTPQKEKTPLTEDVSQQKPQKAAKEGVEGKELEQAQKELAQINQIAKKRYDEYWAKNPEAESTGANNNESAFLTPKEQSQQAELTRKVQKLTDTKRGIESQEDVQEIVKLKRQLRNKGIDFDKNASLSELRKLVSQQTPSGGTQKAEAGKGKVSQRQDFQNRVIAAQDFRNEAKSVGRKKSVNPDGTITLYHGTSPENATSIKKAGLKDQSYLSLTKKEASPHIQQHKNKEVLEMKVDARDVSFSTGTQEVYAKGRLVLDQDGIWKSPKRIASFKQTQTSPKKTRTAKKGKTSSKTIQPVQQLQLPKAKKTTVKVTKTTGGDTEVIDKKADDLGNGLIIAGKKIIHKPEYNPPEEYGVLETKDSKKDAQKAVSILLQSDVDWTKPWSEIESQAKKYLDKIKDDLGETFRREGILLQYYDEWASNEHIKQAESILDRKLTDKEKQIIKAPKEQLEKSLSEESFNPDFFELIIKSPSKVFPRKVRFLASEKYAENKGLLKPKTYDKVKITPIKSKKSFIKTIEQFTADEDTRYSLSNIYIDKDGNVVVSDARRMFITSKGKLYLPDTQKDQLYETEGKERKIKKAPEENKFPPYKDLIPDDFAYSSIIQANTIDDLVGYIDKTRQLNPYYTEATKLPAIVKFDNVTWGADSEYLSKGLEALRKLGANKIEFKFPSETSTSKTVSEGSPVLIIGRNNKSKVVGKYLLMPINLKKGSNNKLNVSDFIKKSSKTSPPAGSFGKQSDTQTKEQINAQQDVEGQQRLDTPPAQGESQGKQAGSTTLIPNIAAEIAAVAKKSLRPLSIVKTGSKLIMRNLKKGVSHIKTLGNGGKRIARDIELITARTTQKANSDILDIKKVYRKVSKKNREKIAKVLNGRTTDAPNWIKQRANKLREILDRSMNEASKLGVERKLPDGTKLPLKGSGKAFPQIPNEAGKQMLEEAENEGLGSKRVFAVAQELVQQEQAESIDEAVILLQQFRKQQLRRANSYLEQSRVELPEEYIEWDGREVLPSLIQKNWLTVEGVRQWGTDTAEQSFPKARARIEQIRTEKGSYEANKVESFIETGFGLGADVSPRIRNISDVIRGYQFDTKIALSLPTILRNMFDRIAKGMTISPVMHFKTYLKYPPFINKLIKSARSLEEEMVRRGAVFSHGSIAEGYEPGSFATKTMGKPFSSSERGNQVHIALTSYYKLMRDVELLQKKTKGDKLANHLADKISGILGRSSGQVKYRLKEMGLEGDVIDNLQEGQKLTEEQVNTILHEAVRDKAFPMIMSTKPIWYDNHPMVKVLMQFKTWPIRQTEMIWNDVAKYTVKTGDPTRLLGFLVGTLIAGEMYNIVRDYLTDRDESILRYMLETEDEETKEIVKRIGTDLLDGGVVGMFADFTYGIWDWAKGVSANTLSNVSETALHIKKRPELTPQALMQLLKKEASPARQVTTYIDKIDRKFINKKNLTKNFYKYRRKAWEFRNDYNNPTLKEQIQKSTEDIFWGKQDYRPGENTLSYRLAARQITVGDFKDAGKYIKIVLDSGTKLSTVKRTLESWYSPLGPIKNDKMKEFYKQLTPKERNEARELQKKWRTNMYKAINQAR